MFFLLKHMIKTFLLDMVFDCHVGLRLHFIIGHIQQKSTTKADDLHVFFMNLPCVVLLQKLCGDFIILYFPNDSNQPSLGESIFKGPSFSASRENFMFFHLSQDAELILSTFCPVIKWCIRCFFK